MSAPGRGAADCGMLRIRACPRRGFPPPGRRQAPPLLCGDHPLGEGLGVRATTAQSACSAVNAGDFLARCWISVRAPSGGGRRGCERRPKRAVKCTLVRDGDFSLHREDSRNFGKASLQTGLMPEHFGAAGSRRSGTAAEPSLEPQVHQEPQEGVRDSRETPSRDSGS